MEKPRRWDSLDHSRQVSALIDACGHITTGAIEMLTERINEFADSPKAVSKADLVKIVGLLPDTRSTAIAEINELYDDDELVQLANWGKTREEAALTDTLEDVAREFRSGRLEALGMIARKLAFFSDQTIIDFALYLRDTISGRRPPSSAAASATASAAPQTVFRFPHTTSPIPQAMAPAPQATAPIPQAMAPIPQATSAAPPSQDRRAPARRRFPVAVAANIAAFVVIVGLGAGWANSSRVAQIDRERAAALDERVDHLVSARRNMVKLANLLINEDLPAKEEWATILQGFRQMSDQLERSLAGERVQENE